jgi:hypothetical protein
MQLSTAPAALFAAVKSSGSCRRRAVPVKESRTGRPEAEIVSGGSATDSAEDRKVLITFLKTL